MKTKEIDEYCRKLSKLFYEQYTDQLQMTCGAPDGDKYVIWFKSQNNRIGVYLDEQGKLQVHENSSNIASLR